MAARRAPTKSTGEGGLGAFVYWLIDGAESVGTVGDPIYGRCHRGDGIALGTRAEDSVAMVPLAAVGGNWVDWARRQSSVRLTAVGVDDNASTP